MADDTQANAAGDQGDASTGMSVLEAKWPRSPAFVECYANATKVRVSNWDVVFQLGAIVEDEDGKTAVEHRASVVMSPMHAKAVYQLLGDRLRVYEQNFGKIPFPPDLPEPSEPKDE